MCIKNKKIHPDDKICTPCKQLNALINKSYKHREIYLQYSEQTKRRKSIDNKDI